MKGKARIKVTLAAVLPVLVCVNAAQAQVGLFNPPEGCETYMTVQSQACTVTNHYVCPQIDPDHKFRTDFGEAGPYFTSHIDGDAQWVASGPPEDPQQTRTVPPEGDPGSVSELIENGVDTFDFYQFSADEGRTRVTGFDKIIGEIEIDGEPLYRTEFDMKRTDESGRVIEHVRGKEYVSGVHKRFFAGFAADVVDGKETGGRDRSPVEFIYPGEPGFGATYPRYGCELLSGLDPRAKPGESLTGGEAQPRLSASIYEIHVRTTLDVIANVTKAPARWGRSGARPAGLRPLFRAGVRRTEAPA